MKKNFLLSSAFFVLSVVYCLLPAFSFAQDAPPPAYSGSTQKSETIGIGVTLKIDSTQGYKRTAIITVVPNTPAHSIGLQPGDIIMNVDNKSAVNVPLIDVVAMIKGEEGTAVKLVIDRKGTIYTYTITRKKYTYDPNSSAGSGTSNNASTSNFLLDFSSYALDTDNTEKKEEPKPDEKKTQTTWDTTGSSGLLLDFSAYDWNDGNTEKKTEPEKKDDADIMHELDSIMGIYDTKEDVVTEEKKTVDTDSYLLDFSQFNINSSGSSSTTATETVTIGSLTWAGKNLEVTTFRNGDPILEAQSKTDWLNALRDGKPAWCYLNSDAANGAKYGKLYNQYAVLDPRGLAPAGWHIPKSDEEWGGLLYGLGSDYVVKLRSTTGWKQSSLAGTNASGFNALPGGYRDREGDFIASDGSAGYWWSTSAESSWGMVFGYYSLIMRYNNADTEWRTLNGVGLSVRCVKD